MTERLPLCRCGSQELEQWRVTERSDPLPPAATLWTLACSWCRDAQEAGYRPPTEGVVR
jgi:hypothetical protein